MKPRFILRNGIWRESSANPKPRFKVTSAGRIALIRPALPSYVTDEISMKRAVVEHYGSVAAFVRRWGFTSNSAICALNPYYQQSAGKVRTVRLVLGMPSRPTQQACVQAFHKATRPQVYFKRAGGDQ